MAPSDEETFLHGLEVLQKQVHTGGTRGQASSFGILAEPLTEERRENVIHDIEMIVLRILQKLTSDGAPELLIPRTTNWGQNDAMLTEPTSETTTGLASSAAGANPEAPLVSRVSFDVVASRRRFAVLTLLLARVHKQLSTRATGTRRQLYYEEVDFLKSQREVDDGVLSVGRLLGLPPWQLGLMATAKGLVAGDLTLTTTDGEVLDCRSKPGGVLIPGDVCSIQNVQSCARFILVLEKDTIFQRVLQEGILDRLGPCIIVTGRGYPDVSTRALLCRLEAELKVPMLAVVDADPHGVHIMCVYRFGTRTCPLALLSLRWLGVLPSELCALGLRGAPLTARDAALARTLLDKQCLRDDPRISAEVEMFLSNNLKGEIDALIHFSPCYITDVYLPNKIAAAHAL